MNTISSLRLRRLFKYICYVALSFSIFFQIIITGCESHNINDSINITIRSVYDIRINPDYADYDYECRIQDFSVLIYSNGMLIKKLHWWKQFYESLDIPYGERYFYSLKIRANFGEIRIILTPDNKLNLSSKYLPLIIDKKEFIFEAITNSYLTIDPVFINEDYSKIRIKNPYCHTGIMIDGDYAGMEDEVSNQNIEYLYTKGNKALIFTYEFGHFSKHIDELELSINPDKCYMIEIGSNYQIISVNEYPLSIN